jgi:hypothetical protein
MPFEIPVAERLGYVQKITASKRQRGRTLNSSRFAASPSLTLRVSFVGRSLSIEKLPSRATQMSGGCGLNMAGHSACPRLHWRSLRRSRTQLSLSVRIAEAACKTKLNVPFRELVQLAAELGHGAICMRSSAGGNGTPHRELERMRGEVERAGLRVSMVTADSDVPLNDECSPVSGRVEGGTSSFPVA